MVARPYESEVAAAERALMDRLFSEQGRAHPEAVVRSSTVPGCRYAFVQQVLHDPRFVAPELPPSPDLMFQVVARFMSRLPPDRHRAVRTLFSGLFTPRRVARFRERVVARVDALLDAFPATGPLELVSALTRPLPFSVIADVLGVPTNRHTWLATEMDTFGRAVAGQRDHANVELGNLATARMLEYFDGEIARRAAQPQDDLMTLLAGGPTTGEQYDDVLANCLFFILAGHATTTALLSAGVQLLVEQPGALPRLTAEPAVWPTAVEELLRFVSPATLTASKALADAEPDGWPVRAGSQRALVFTAANRDPDVFSDPEAFDVARTPNPHVAFSAGAHFCLGAPLARMHAEVALPALFDRLPGLRLVEDPVWLGSVPIRQIASMLVTWDRNG